MQFKTFSAHNRVGNSHDVSRKRFITHAETGRPRLFHVQNKPRRGWRPRRFAALIPSGCRLTPIHKVMGDHASRGTTPAGALRHMDFRDWAFTMTFSGGHSRCAPFQNTFPEYHYTCLSRIPLHVPFQNVHFRLSYPMNSHDGHSMIRVSMCSISEQVGRVIFGYITVCQWVTKMYPCQVS